MLMNPAILLEEACCAGGLLLFLRSSGGIRLGFLVVTGSRGRNGWVVVVFYHWWGSTLAEST